MALSVGMGSVLEIESTGALNGRRGRFAEIAFRLLGIFEVIVKSGVYAFNPLGFYSPQLAANISE
ncbi:MAG: hypothetical protein KZQ60_17235 [Candidatus Thiodiazotropha sp. (ex Lucinoma aequizonata)]|nr:hypothetical protein [Candidatus Thiodiazotropha sp. (ex Lucinoma aequizonata)]